MIPVSGALRARVNTHVWVVAAGLVNTLERCQEITLATTRVVIFQESLFPVQ